MTPGTQLGRTFLSGISSLFCAVNVTSIDTPPNIIFTWLGPQGQVTDDEKYDSNEGVAADELQFGVNEEDYTHYSNLVIRDLTLLDNETQYYCVVQVGVYDTFNQSSYIIPGTTTSENITVLVEGVYAFVCIFAYLCLYNICLFFFICKTHIYILIFIYRYCDIISHELFCGWMFVI